MRRRAAWLLVRVLALAALAAPASARAQSGQHLAPTCPPTAQWPSAEERRAASRQAPDRGLLWRIERDGRTSYLFGTLHIGRPDWLAPGPRVQQALRSSDLLALEIDLTDPAVTALPPTPTPGAGLPPLPAALGARVRREAERACLPPEAVARLHPVMQGVMLSLVVLRRDGLDSAFGQEIALAGVAREAGLPIVSMETMALQMAALLPDTPAEAEALLEGALTQLESGRARPLMLRLARAWERGDLEDLAAYPSWCECARDAAERAFYRRVNDGRNAGLAARIDEMHRSGRKVFAAVGALHMTGPQALPLLLAGKGYRIERVH